MNNWKRQSVWENTHFQKGEQNTWGGEDGSPQGIMWRKGKPEERAVKCFCWDQSRGRNAYVYVYETPFPQICTSCHGFWLPLSSFWNSKCSLRYPKLFRHTSDIVFFLPILLTSPLLANPACFNDFIKMKTITWRNGNYEGRHLVNTPENSAMGCAVGSAFNIWINGCLNKDHKFSWTSHLYFFSSNKLMK